MQYRRNWDGLTEIVPEGNAMKVAETKNKAHSGEKIIHVDTFMPNHLEHVRTPQNRSQKHRKRRRVYLPDIIRLTFQVITMMAMLMMILAIDTVTSLPGTAIMMGGILGCAGILLLLDENER